MACGAHDKVAPRAIVGSFRLVVATLVGVLLLCGSQMGCASGPAEGGASPETLQSSADASSQVDSGAQDDAQTPVELHGRPRVSGTSLVDEAGEPFQVKGISTHGLAWYPQFVNAEAFQTWRDWGANTVRLSLYSDGDGGWCSGGDREKLLATLYDGVDAASSEGMYAIVDWHILSDGNPLTHAEEAEEFFSAVAQHYPNQANVIYEICNEPNGGTTWDQIHDYASQIIPVIRTNSPDAVVVVGTPNWSQDVDQVTSKPLAFDNLVYSLHFYAGTHKGSLREKAEAALTAGTPLLVSEFGITDASGNGSCDEASANEWMSFLDDNGIGYVCWSLSNKDESSALISSTCSKTSGWSLADLSEEGKWYVGVLSVGLSASGEDESASDAAAVGPTGAGGSGKVEVSCPIESSWDSGGEHYSLCRISVSNQSSTDIEGWKATVTFGSEVTVEQAWGATCTASGSTVLLEPSEYASEVKAGATQSGQVGFIVHGAVVPTVTSVSVE